MPKAMRQAFREAMPAKQCQSRNADKTRQDQTTKTTTTQLKLSSCVSDARRGGATK